MTQDNYEGTDPCKEVGLEWRHQKIEYLKRLIDQLPSKDKIDIYYYLQKEIII